MKRMILHGTLSQWPALALVWVPFFAIACHGGNKQQYLIPSKAAQPQVSGVSTRPDIDLNCVMNSLQNPKEAFHYHFETQSANFWREDADVTPQQISGTFMNNSLPGPQHFAGPPGSVASNLMAIGRMASLLATVHGTAAVQVVGTEKANGYDTTKFSIDTAQGTDAEQQLYKSVLGPGGFEKGTVWATQGGCPVKLDLSEELHARDGSVTDKVSYQEAMVKQ